MKYADKLKDPRWQKKRLEVLNENEFTCYICANDKLTLHVHHRKYCDEPWNIENKYLVVLCERCHNKEHKIKQKYIEKISEILKNEMYIVAENLYLMLFAIKESGEYSDGCEELLLDMAQIILLNKNISYEISKMVWRYAKDVK